MQERKVNISREAVRLRSQTQTAGMNSSETLKPREKTQHSASLDLFRATAILIVIGVHLSGYFGVPGRYEGIAIVAVNGFLVLSGFLLSGPYLRAVLDPTSVFPSTKFYALRRFARIYPAYALAVIVTAAPYFFVRNHHGVSLLDVAAHLSMTHGFFKPFVQSAFNVPLWTMAVDAQFYVTLPAVAFVMRQFALRTNPGGRRRLILLSLALCILVSLALRLWVYRVTPAIDDYKAALVYARNALGLGSSFAFGIAIAYARIEGLKPSRPLSLGLIVLALVCTVSLTVDGAQYSRDYVANVSYDFLGAMGAAALLYGIGQGTFAVVHRLSSLPVVNWVAAISYGLYLFHKPFSILAIHLIGRRLPIHTLAYGFVVTVITLSCTIAAATIMFRYVETPSRFLTSRMRSGAEKDGAVVGAALGNATGATT